MKADHENFEGLQQLLQTKRNPAPPPDLSRSIMAGLHYRKPAVPQPWWRQLQAAVMDSRPVQVSILGVAVGGLLAAGLAYSNSLEKQGESGAFNDPSSLLASHATNATAPKLTLDGAGATAQIPASTEPLLGTNTSPFRFNTLGTRAQPVRYGLNY